MTTKNSFTDKIVKAKCSGINFLNLLDGKKMESKAERTFVRNDNFCKLLVKNEVYLKGSKNNFTIFIFSYHVQFNF